MRQVDHWIGGQRTQGSPKTMFEVTDPVTGSVIATVPMASAGDVDLAVGTARTAWDGWREASISSRAAVMFAFRELLEEHRLELAEMVSAEHGKVRADAMGELRRGIEVVEFACGIGQLLKGERTDDISTEHDAYTVRQPVGVVAGITPFNFPAMVPMWMYPVAIASGNCVRAQAVREGSRRWRVRIGELFAEAGLPDGVFSVLHGDADAVNGLCEHPGIDAVSFVGSTPIARHVHRTASMAGKRVQALGGAKNHMIVLPDAVIGQAADAAVSAGYGSAGERCMAISVVVAVGAIADDLSEAPSASGSTHCASAPDLVPRPSTWARSSLQSTVIECSATSTWASPKAQFWYVTAVALWWTATRTATGSGPLCSTRSPPR